ncbi:MAG: hypothetical protein K2Y23_17740 [Cyanobacteria bacterium]|nr:hypothetical protein [Cyanobacteriota bacterium]
MDAREEADGTLILTCDSSLWTKWLIGATLVLLGTAAYDYFFGRQGEDRMIGLLAGAATCAISALVMLEQSTFRVDPRSRLIEWEQRWGFRQRAGVTPFADIKHVSAERPIGDTGVPSRRVCLHLADGSLLPITVGYRPDGDEKISDAAALLRRVLEQSDRANQFGRG